MIYDAIIVGARCAGSPTAMLLARAGQRVLLVDRAGFPSDTVSAHAIQPAGVARLASWGLLDDVRGLGAPFLDVVRFDAGDVVIEGSPRPIDGITSLVAPRRTLLDAMLVDAAAAAGAEVRLGFTVKELLVEEGRVVGIAGRNAAGRYVEERSRIVVGADGKSSLVARLVGATAYAEQEATTVAAYTYYRNVEGRAVELYTRPNRLTIVLPTNDDLVIVSQVVAIGDQATYRADIAGAFQATLEELPLADRFAGAERVERFRFTSDTGGFFRVPHGPGWVLVGDAGYHKDPITAQGMLDAFRDADLLANAVTSAGSPSELDQRLCDYHTARDRAVRDMYGFTCDLARVDQPPTPELVALFQALAGNTEHIPRFLGLMAGSVPVSEFFSPDSLAAIQRSALAPA